MRAARHLACLSVLVAVLAVSAALLLQITQRPVLAATNSTEGSLQVIESGKPAGLCPLQHTEVKADISGFSARVAVTQEFANSSSDKIEAVYTFPLPQNAAVDDMIIQVGPRTIRGLIKKREEAAAMYAKAIEQGQMAALLDQERPNIFTQTVGNIPPGAAVRVTIRYIARLKYEDGGYEFVFPMVVGPRYIPGTTAIGHQGGGWAPDTDKVPDASKITPPVTAPGTRAGHDISIALNLDAGVPIEGLRSPTHAIDVQRTGASSANVRLRNASEIPNKDFILRYDVAGPSIVEGLLTHADRAVAPSARGSAQNGYFSLVIQPAERFPEFDVTPKEIVFVLDSSGSMNGFPEEKSKRLIDYAIDGLYPGDTFNVIKFSGDTAVLFDQPRYPSAANVQQAKQFVDLNWGGGGTEMMKAIRAALAPSDASDHVRIVVFLTDGYVGNDMEIISEIQKRPNARIFAYGVGSSVNRFLLDKMAEAGRGAVEYVSFKQDDKEAEAAAHRLYERLRAPLLTDISLDFGTLPVRDVYPRQIPDLFSAKPVVITGRYTGPAKGTIRLVAKRAGDSYTKEISVNFPAQNGRNEALPSLWARERIDDLMAQDWAGLQRGNMRDELRNQITQLGLDYRLVTQFTSFVAVEDRVVTDSGQARRIQVPVELPEGVQHEEGWSGGAPGGLAMYARLASPQRAIATTGVSGGVAGGRMGGAIGGVLSSPAANGSGGGIGSGYGGGVGSGRGTGVGPGYGGGIGGGVFRVGGGISAPRAISAPAPQYTDAARKANLQGTVVLWAIVRPDGIPSDIRVARSIGTGLDEKAVEAVRTWRFQPAMKDGRPAAAQINIEVTFANGIAKTNMASGAALNSAPANPVRVIDTKLHPQLVAAYDCWHAQSHKETAQARCHLKEDKLLVYVILSEEWKLVIPELKAIGFEPLPAQNRPKHVVGRVRVEQLAALANTRGVVFVAPETQRISDPITTRRWAEE